jgi:hyperosmotically inducible protein
VLVVLALIATFTPGCRSMTGRSVGRYIDDKTVTAKVKAKLVDDRASNLTRVGVTTVNGTVYLDGVVDAPHEKARAEELARHVDGVVSVVNQLQVNAPAAAPAPR